MFCHAFQCLYTAQIFLNQSEVSSLLKLDACGVTGVMIVVVAELEKKLRLVQFEK
jgi:hypothetical protein